MKYKLELTAQQLELIGQILGKQPYEVVANLIAELRRQTQEQQRPQHQGPHLVEDEAS